MPTRDVTLYGAMMYSIPTIPPLDRSREPEFQGLIDQKTKPVGSLAIPFAKLMVLDWSERGR